MSYLVAGSVFAVLLIATVLRDFVRVSLRLAVLSSAYAVAVTWFSSRNYFLASAQTLPPLGLITGQVFLAVLVTSVFILGAKAWRSIPVDRFFVWHAYRLPMGVIMVLLAVSGRLAPEFGWGAGVGEVFVGLWALLYISIPTTRTPQSVIVWCVVGLLDVIVGTVTAVLTFRSPVQYFPHAPEMTIMSTIPMVVNPSFFMAVLTSSTFLVFSRRKELREVVVES